MEFDSVSGSRKRGRSAVWSQLGFPLAQAGLFAAFSLILRFILAAKFGPGSTAQGLPEAVAPVISLSAWMQVFAMGTLLDLVVAMLLFLPSALWIVACPRRWWQARWQRCLFLGGTWFWWTLVIFVLQGEYWFFGEYTSRYNTVAIDYLHYWTEVSSNV